MVVQHWQQKQVLCLKLTKRLFNNVGKGPAVIIYPNIVCVAHVNFTVETLWAWTSSSSLSAPFTHIYIVLTSDFNLELWAIYADGKISPFTGQQIWF